MTTPGASQGISFEQVYGDRISIRFPDGRLAAEYQYGTALPKPCFHPLITHAGHTITGFEMSDHVWHRGLWFAIKFLNKTNFWEENPPFGVQATVHDPGCRMMEGNGVLIRHLLRWSSEATGPIVDENRSIMVVVRDTCEIDWQSTLTALQDIELDRTPYTTWGGYGGITYRASREVHKTHFQLPGGEQTNAVIGDSHPWLLIRGIVDGGVDQRVSLGIVDHPSNRRAPSPWYGKTGDSYDFMNAAFLFHEPMKVTKWETLNFRYRVLYRDGWWEANEFGRLADVFRKSTAQYG
jgi:hypothetical protein